ncbi:MAG: hypothetical protein JWQ40_847 [Segetibacter sp.]|jgi:uncharacterized membrane protein|nr:hypothetical protein [Segetibacter sp.]
MKAIRFFLSFSQLFIVQQTFACVNCNKEIRDAIFDSAFYPNILVILSPFVLLAIVVAIIASISTKRHKARLQANPVPTILSPVPLTAAATVLGIGIGGFIDGIVFHQVLQWHEMLSNKIPATTYLGKSVNMFWDGIFHAFTLLVTITGVVLLWKLLHRKDIDRSGNLLVGGLLFGWGLFNILEGIADHQVLKLHNVREISSNKEAWNLGFLAFSVVLVIIGLLIAKKKKGHDGGYSVT